MILSGLLPTGTHLLRHIPRQLNRAVGQNLTNVCQKSVTLLEDLRISDQRAEAQKNKLAAR
jgi:hypothetical protein